MASTEENKRFLLVTYPRTASNLLLKILALQTQPNILCNSQDPQGGNGYFFLRNQFLKSKLGTHGNDMKGWTEMQKTELMESTQSCFNELEEYVKEAGAQGKIAFVKEHIHFLTEPSAQNRFLFGDSSEQEPWTVQLPSSYGGGSRSLGNDTIFPDEFLQTWRPTFLIRHPALVFPSYYRACLDMPHFKSTDNQFNLFMTFTWQRRLYDWYQKRHSGNADDTNVWPLILDADDVITEPTVVTQYCDILGIDPSKLKFEWAPTTDEERAKIKNPAVERLLSTILASSGIQKDKVAANIDIDAEAAKWRTEFGETAGAKMENWVRGAMPDYEYMREKRLRAKPISLKG